MVSPLDTHPKLLSTEDGRVNGLRPDRAPRRVDWMQPGSGDWPSARRHLPSACVRNGSQGGAPRSPGQPPQSPPHVRPPRAAHLAGRATVAWRPARLPEPESSTALSAGLQDRLQVSGRPRCAVTLRETEAPRREPSQGPAFGDRATGGVGLEAEAGSPGGSRPPPEGRSPRGAEAAGLGRAQRVPAAGEGSVWVPAMPRTPAKARAGGQDAGW